MKQLAAITCALALAASGCVSNRATVEMFALCAPPDDAAKCGMSGGKCDAYLASARPFVFLTVGAAANGFEMFTEVHNQAPNNADPSAGRANTNDAIVTGYELDFSSELYNRTNYFFPANFGVPAGGGFVPVIKYIPDEVAMDMRTVFGAQGATAPIPVTVTVRLKGHLLDGVEFTTGDFLITIDVWNTAFLGYTCPKLGDVVSAVCPAVGQTSSWACTTP
jgi:hypothetical protein